MDFSHINIETVENEVGGLEGSLGAPTSPLCDSFKRQRTFSDISTEPNSPSCSNMSPTSTMASSPRLGSMSPMMGISSPCLGHVLPEVDQFKPLQRLPTILSQSNLSLFYEPDGDDENPLALSFLNLFSYSLEGEAKEEQEEDKDEHGTKEDVDNDDDEEEDEQETKYVERDGIKWVVTRGSPPSMPQLEDQLAEVKSLYKAKYGEDFDDEEEEEEEEEEEDEEETKYVEKDGLKWVVTRGSPPSMSDLEEQLAEVKSLYKAKYGEDVDNEEEDEEDEQETKYVEKDGLKWVVTRGSPPEMSQLEDKLAEVKSLYKAKYGEDVDEESEDEEDEEETKYVEKDGLKWVVTRGSPPSMSQLEDRLAEVKSLYKSKYDEDVDEEEEEEQEEEKNEEAPEYVEKDGIKWIVARGSPPTMSQLEDKLKEVKVLYAKKFGESVDDDE